MRLCIAFCTLWMSCLALGSADDYKVFCYFGSWAGYRPGIGKFHPEDIDATLCTHLLYAFVGVSEDGNVTVIDPWNDLPDDGGKNGFARFVALRNTSKDSKFLVTIGGWNEGSEKFSAVVNNEALRSTFVDNVVKFVHYYGFDGLDLDWEFPAQRGGLASDVENFVLLLAELREKFDEHGLILTAAVGAEISDAKLSYDISGMSKYLDYIIMMTYDFHNTWDPITGHNAPLYPAKREITELDRSLNVEASVNYWLEQGALPKKIILGTPFQGKTFTLNNTRDNEPGSPMLGPGNAGEYTRIKGMLAYYEICQLEANASWTFRFDEEQRVPYGYSGNQWVTYDNVESIKEKANYVIKRGLGGVMMWSIDTDDFRGVCGEKYPLLHALIDVLSNGSSNTNKNQPAIRCHVLFAGIIAIIFLQSVIFYDL